MKKKLFAAALALLVLLGCATVGWAGSQSDPLISLSYLNGTFLAGLKAYVTQWVAQDTQSLYDAAAAKAEQTTVSADGWIASFGFEPGEVEYGGTIILATGSGLIWTSGSGTVSAGALVDTTVGMELTEGSALTAGHRYLAGTDARVDVSSQSAQWMAEGNWRLSGEGTPEPPAMPFTDVSESAWYYDDVRFVLESGLFDGVTDTQFCPRNTMSRGMMATVLYRMAGEPEVGYSPVFSDVPEGKWYTKGIVWCAKMDIVGGTGGGLFEPGQTIARQQIATMLYNYAVIAGKPVSERGNLNAFSDADSVSFWAKDAMRWAVGAGILDGSDDGKLLPQDGATRAHVAAMLNRFHSWLEAR